MHIHYLQHVPFEDLGSMASYFDRQGHRLSATHLYQNQPLPTPDAFDWLIIMGGPMGVGDEKQFDWMIKEKVLIKESIDAGKIVLGICLGAQLIAEALNAKVYPNALREIGWFPVFDTGQAHGTLLEDVIPEGLEVFHWHGDTFDNPGGSVALAASEACRNQGFVFDDRIVGLQFHLETTPTSAKALLDNCRHELDGSRFVQSEAHILSNMALCAPMNAIMISLLKRLEAKYGQ